MRAPLSWLRELVDIPADQSGRDVAERLIRAGLEVETVETIGGGVIGDLVVGKVLEVEELTEFKKPIRWCQVDVGPAHGGVHGIICGARNFVAGDVVVVALPGTTLPGGFTITARETYGHVSDGMICSERELALSDSHEGIMILAEGMPGDDAKALLGVGDEVLDISVTPDRGYALSMRGIARELATAYGVSFNDPIDREINLPAPSPTHAPVECGSEDLQACALFTMRTVMGIDPSAHSPRWMQQRLSACGMRPVSLAVDITNYVMLELGQPLHAFDMAKIRGAIRPAHVPAGTVFETLDHVKRSLVDDDLVIRDDSGPIGLAGVMGGLTSEVEDGTTDIALEAAWFSADYVARASRRHKLSSEASRRYERGVDRVLAPYASARAIELLLDLAGGTYCGMTAVEAPFDPTVIVMRADEPARIAGMPITRDVVVSLLTSVGCEVDGDEMLTVTAPSWRPDLTDPADLVEEVVRLVGYDTLPSTLPIAALGHGLTPAQRMRRRVGAALAARGAVEILTYPFVGSVELDALRLPADDPRRVTAKLANPISDEQPHLRGTLVPGLLAAAQRNLGRGTTHLRLFEIGSVFQGALGKPVGRVSVDDRPTSAQWNAINAQLPQQPSHVAVVLTGDHSPAGWWGPAVPQTWAAAIEHARLVGDCLGVAIDVQQGDDPMLHPGRAARILVGGVQVGIAGELHPRAVEAMGLPARTCVMELDLSATMAAAPEVRPAPAVSGHPVAKEDIALVVDASIPVSTVQAAVAAGAGELLESVRLFDVYAGAQVPEGKRSLAFALRFRASDRTLSAADIATAREGAIAEAARQCGAVLR